MHNNHHFQNPDFQKKIPVRIIWAFSCSTTTIFQIPVYQKKTHCLIYLMNGELFRHTAPNNSMCCVNTTWEIHGTFFLNILIFQALFLFITGEFLFNSLFDKKKTLHAMQRVSLFGMLPPSPMGFPPNGFPGVPGYAEQSSSPFGRTAITLIYLELTTNVELLTDTALKSAKKSESEIIYHTVLYYTITWEIFRLIYFIFCTEIMMFLILQYL